METGIKFKYFLHLNHNNYTVIGCRSACYMMLQRYKESYEDCQKALKINPDLLKVSSRCCRILIKLGEWDTAQEKLNELLNQIDCEIQVRRDQEKDEKAATQISSLEVLRQQVNETFQDLEEVRTIVGRIEGNERTMNYQNIIHQFSFSL